jgi:glycosyltransferase involved in cell wall biosynthesis
MHPDRTLGMFGLETISQILCKVAMRLSSARFLPCFVLSRNPLIITSYWADFAEQKEAILQTLPTDKTVYVLFMFGWHKETEDKMREVQEWAVRTLEERPNLSFRFLCNSAREQELARQMGLTATFCHQNAFIDESRYRVLPAQKKYDAIYIARISPFKRHELAANIPSLKLIGDYRPSETAHYHKVMELLKGADYTRKVPAFDVPKYLCEAHVGLCLSKEEGAMFVSAEYLLCGLPVVSTKNLGGRDALFEPEYALVPEDTPEAVAAAVQSLKERDICPDRIRNRTIQKMKAHRQVLIDILQEIYDAEGVRRIFADEFDSIFIHKLGIRTNLPIATQFTRVLREGMKL